MSENKAQEIYLPGVWVHCTAEHVDTGEEFKVFQNVKTKKWWVIPVTEQEQPS